MNLPVGTNFIIAGYAYGQGNILVDSSIPLEDFNTNLNTFVLAYLRSINFFGKSAKFDVILPYSTGDSKYTFEGEELTNSANGFGDLRLRFSLNLVGAPVLSKKEYADYKQKTVVGYSLQTVIPTGQYNSSQLPNLGSNRWTIKNQVGISHTMDKWIVEGYISFWLFSTNNDYLNGKELKQAPFLGVKTHLIRLFENHMWLAADIGYGIGGSTEINDTKLNTKMSTFRFGLTYSVPIGENHSLKFTAVSGIRIERGPDFDAVGIGYQYRWN